LAELFEKIDIPMDVDLGQLISGQHVVLKGITLRTPWGSVLRYAFVPGFSQTDRALDTSWGLGKVMDDMGTDYDHQGAGGWGADADGIVLGAMRTWETASPRQQLGYGSSSITPTIGSRQSPGRGR
jgi:hypothetical protein